MKTQTSSPVEPVRILVVDDHPNTATTLARALAQIGPAVDVVSAVSGNDALEKVKNKGVDILFTDMIMPEMTGLELIEKMQNHPGGKPSFAYLITAYDVPGLKVTAQRLKVNEVIIKPVRPERICQIANAAIDEMKHITHPMGKKAGAKRKFKILVADDVMDNVTLLTRYLEYEGYDQIIARDGMEALNRIRDEMPDLVLLDVNMPHKDGFTVLEEIREDPAISHIPVIILTAARLDPADVQSGLNLGADDYVTKPFDRHELMARIRTKLRVKEAEDVTRRRIRELNLLPEIGKQLSARLDTKDLANVLLKRTVETLGALQGNMYILGEDESKVQEKYEVALSPSDSAAELNLPAKLIHHIQESHQGLVIEDAVNDPLWQVDESLTVRSALAAPIFGRHSLLGMILLTHEQEGYFTNDHLRLLQAIASQAAIAIENARLYSSVTAEQKKVTAILQHASEAILLFDADCKLSLMNPAGEQLFLEHPVKLNQPLPAEGGYEAFTHLIKEALDAKMSKSGEVVWPDKRTFTAFIAPIEDGGTVAILHDVSRFKDLDRIKNEFIATASHDLKNPLTSIGGYAQLMGQAGPLTDNQKDFVERIKHSVKNMSELIQNMMSLAQVDLQAVQKHEIVNLSDLLIELSNEFQPLAQEKLQSLDMEFPSTPVYVSGDPLHLRQIFRNLIGNAIKYTPQGGRVQVKSKVYSEQVTVEVEDNGYGIPASDLPFIFNRFYRVRSGKASEVEGNGLGLAIVKSMVEQHSGQITVESEIGKGSCFTLTLPFAGSIDTNSAQNTEVLNKKRVAL
ncbi:MAG: response regulator [Anaerolineales bacterium]|nr:response regulator [Anaerolineales bacterium]